MLRRPIPLAVLLVLAGACGSDSQPSKAEIDAAVAKALATTTTAVGDPAAVGDTTTTTVPQTDPTLPVPRVAPKLAPKPGSNPAPGGSVQPASVSVPAVPAPRPGYVPTRTECNGLSEKVSDAVYAWANTVENVNSSAPLSYIDDVIRLGNDVLRVGRDAVSLCSGIWSSSYDLRSTIPEIESTVKEVQGYRDQRVSTTTTTLRPATTTTGLVTTATTRPATSTTTTTTPPTPKTVLTFKRTATADQVLSQDSETKYVSSRFPKFRIDWTSSKVQSKRADGTIVPPSAGNWWIKFNDGASVSSPSSDDGSPKSGSVIVPATIGNNKVYIYYTTNVNLSFTVTEIA